MNSYLSNQRTRINFEDAFIDIKINDWHNFISYTKNIFHFISTDHSCVIPKMSLYDYLNTHKFISDKIYYSLRKSKRGLNYEDFEDLFSLLFNGSFDQVFNFIFHFLDFEGEGKIKYENAKLILFYLYSDENLQTNDILYNIKYILIPYFENSCVKEISYDELLNITREENSDLFFAILFGLYNTLPLNSNLIQEFSKEKNKIVLTNNSKLKLKENYSIAIPTKSIQMFIKPELFDSVINYSFDKTYFNQENENSEVNDESLNFDPDSYLATNTIESEHDDIIQIPSSFLFTNNFSTKTNSTIISTNPNSEYLLNELNMFPLLNVSIVPLKPKFSKVEKHSSTIKSKSNDNSSKGLVKKHLFKYEKEYYQCEVEFNNFESHLIIYHKLLHLVEKKYNKRTIIFLSSKHTYCRKNELEIIMTYKNEKYCINFKNQKEKTEVTHIIDKMLCIKNFSQIYEEKEVLQKGLDCLVKKAINRKSKEVVCVKIFVKEYLQGNELCNRRYEKMINEKENLKKCKHPNIVKIKDFFQDDHNFYLVMECVEGEDLAQNLLKNKKINEKYIDKIIKSICEAVEYLHNIGIIHRDLKPGNICLSKKMEVKLVDFGFSTVVGEDEMKHELYGSEGFAAPEIVSMQPYSKEIDIWSLGITLYYIIFGAPEEEELPINNSKQLLINLQQKKSVKNMKKFKKYRNLLIGCLENNPKERLNTKQINKLI